MCPLRCAHKNLKRCRAAVHRGGTQIRVVLLAAARKLASLGGLWLEAITMKAGATIRGAIVLPGERIGAAG